MNARFYKYFGFDSYSNYETFIKDKYCFYKKGWWDGRIEEISTFWDMRHFWKKTDPAYMESYKAGVKSVIKDLKKTLGARYR